MRYLIDGYNLLHAMGLLRPKDAAAKALENARLDLLDRLHKLFGDNSHNLTVIFDAGRVPRRGLAEHDYCGIHVRFALRQEADDLIEALIQSEASPKSLTVVSDDRRIQVAARRRQCPVLGCNQFLDVAEREPRSCSVEPVHPNTKPEIGSQEERQRWMAEFAALDNDPALKKWLDPGAIEVEE
jgi:predicted RNA-binding protein with PIN domain